jgi:hypothetical protein
MDDKEYIRCYKAGSRMKEPVDHIVRPSLPWRSSTEPAVTECGYNAESVKTITRDELAARLKEYGEQATAPHANSKVLTVYLFPARLGTWDRERHEQ